MLAALTLSLQIQQSSFDLLDGVSIEIAAHNSANAPQIVRFARPAEYELEVLRGKTVIWTNAAPEPEATSYPVHKRKFIPGPSVIVVYIWNGVDSDGTTPGPGNYTIRARLLGIGETPEASATVHFGSLVPINALETLKTGDVVTIGGTLDATKGILTDAGGSVVLGRRILNAPVTPIAVRGYLLKRYDRTPIFIVQRWAPLS